MNHQLPTQLSVSSVSCAKPPFWDSGTTHLHCSAAPRSRVAAEMAQNDIAADMSEPAAAHGSYSRTSRLQLPSLQRL
ncbi:MAG: hypothetical protein R3E39_11870 [Anaerolineae bacterium]